MKSIFLILSFSFSSLVIGQNMVNYNEVSESLLENIIHKKPFDKHVATLQKSTLTALTNQLKDDDQKVAFWINIYNAFIQIFLQENPELYKDRSAFFSTKRIQIAGQKLSFDEIEHGILRKSKIKLSLGYLRKPFPAEWERKLRVNKVDWRIHFALNCGAKSCPPVTIYKSNQLDKQLDFMTKRFLKSTTSFLVEEGVAEVTKLFSWFRADFDGIPGIKKILKNYNITPIEPVSLDFSEYQWDLLLDNYISIPD